MSAAPTVRAVRVYAVGGSPAIRGLRRDGRFDFACCTDACEMLMRAAGDETPPHAMLFDAEASNALDMRRVSDAAEEAGLPAPITLPDEATPDEVMRTIAPNGELSHTEPEHAEPAPTTAPEADSARHSEPEPAESEPAETPSERIAEAFEPASLAAEFPPTSLTAGRVARALLKGRSLAALAADELGERLGVPVRFAEAAPEPSHLVHASPLVHEDRAVGFLIGPTSAAEDLEQAAADMAAAAAWDRTVPREETPTDHTDLLTGLRTERALVGELALRIDAGRRDREAFEVRLHRVPSETHAEHRAAAIALGVPSFILEPGLLATIGPDTRRTGPHATAAASFPWDALSAEALLTIARGRLPQG